MSCISNINPLYNSYFTLVFGRGTRQFELNCQKANLPGCTVPDTSQPTIFGTTVPVPTMQFNYETLNTEFIIDSNLTNWKSLYSWMRNMSNIDDDTSHNLDYQEWHKTATLTIYVQMPQVFFRVLIKCNLQDYQTSFQQNLDYSLD